MKEIIMSIPQYNALSRGEITLEEIKKANQSEYFAKFVLNDKRLANITVFLIGNLMYCQSVSASPLDPVNSAGNMFLEIIQTVGYWLCLLMCLIEIIRALINSQGDKCGKIVVRYICVFAGLYLMPWLFNIIRDIFSGM